MCSFYSAALSCARPGSLRLAAVGCGLLRLAARWRSFQSVALGCLLGCARRAAFGTTPLLAQSRFVEGCFCSGCGRDGLWVLLNINGTKLSVGRIAVSGKQAASRSAASTQLGNGPAQFRCCCGQACNGSLCPLHGATAELVASRCAHGARVQTVRKSTQH